MMNVEEWRVVASSPSYEVSDQGRVRRARPARNSHVGRVLRQARRNGYLAVNLSENGTARMQSVHRLVAEAFIGPADGREVNHRNGLKKDNRAWNLEYATRVENALHAHRSGLQDCRGERNGRAKLTLQKVREIRARAASGESFASIARATGTSATCIWNVVNRRRWAHVE